MATISLIGRVRAAADTRGDALAVAEPGADLAYRDLAGRAAALQRALGDLGVGAGDVVALAGYTLADLAVMVVAAAGLGAVVYPFNLRKDTLARAEGAAGRQAHIDRYGVTAVVVAGYPEGVWTAGRPVVHLDELSPGGPPIDRAPDGGVTLAVESERHDALVRLPGPATWQGALAFGQRLGLTRVDRVLTVGPPHLDVVLLTLLATLAVGGTAVAPGRVTAMGDGVRGVAARYQATVLVAAPRPAALLARTAEDDGARLPDLRAAVLVRDWVPARLPAALRRVAGPDLAVWYGWGGAPGGILATVGPLRTTPSGTLLLPGDGVRVLDPDGAPVPAPDPGELCCAGPRIATEVLDDPGLAARLFVTGPDGQRVYRSGDLGRAHPDGTVELVALASGPDGARATEAVIEEWTDVRLARVVAVGDELVAFVETVSGNRVDPAAVREHVAARLPARPVPVLVVTVPDGPMAESGAVDYDRLRVRARALLAGSPDAGAGADFATGPASDPGAERILRTIAEVLGVPGLTATTNLFEIGATSLEIVRAVTRLEADLDFEVDLDELLDEPRVGTLIRQYRAARVPVAEAR